MYKHYIRVKDGLIIHRFSSAFEETQDGDICVNEDGARHYNDPVMNERAQYISRWVDGEEVVRTQEELDAEWSNRPAPKTAEERIAELEAENLTNMLALVELHGLILSMGGGAE